MEMRRAKDLLARMILWQVECGIPFRQVLNDLRQQEIGMTANEVAEVLEEFADKHFFNKLYRDNVNRRMWDFKSKRKE